MPDPTYRYRQDRLFMDGVPLAAVAAQVGTPVYVYSLRRILAQLDRLRAAFAPLEPSFHYSLKANANGHLVRALVEAGCGCDAVSAGEIFVALRAGCPPDQIVFAGVGKTADEIRYALEQNIGWFNVENAGELSRLDALAGELGRHPTVALRLNPALQAATHRHIATGHEGAKFGIPVAEARALLQNRAAYPRLHLAGLHVHIGSQLGRPDESAQAARIALDLARAFDLQHLNLGGGFPVPYDSPSPFMERGSGGEVLPSLLAESRAPHARGPEGEVGEVPVEAFAAALLPILAGQGVHAAFEPGRFLVAEAGVLLAEVQYVKNGGKTIVLNAGMTDLIRPALYGARHPLWPLRCSDGPTQPIQVVGPICESADVLHPAAPLPPLAPGDLVAIGVAGAYGMSMASTYNGRPRPAEVLVEGDSWRLIRRRETFADLVRLEAD